MSKYKNAQLRRKKRIYLYWRLALTVSFLVVFLYGASFWSSHESVNIKGLKVKGNKYIATETVEDIFWEEVEGRYIFILSKKNFLLLPKKTIVAKLKREISVKDALIKSNPDGAEIEIIEHKSEGEYCREEECFLINADGLIFAKSPLVMMENLVKYTGAKEENVLGQTYTDSKVFRKISQIIGLLKRINVSIKSVSTEDFETFNLQSLEGPYLLIDKSDDSTLVVNNLKTTIEQEAIHEIQFKNIEYIDLRFGNKVYYKIK